MTGCRKKRIAGWILSVLVSVFLAAASAPGKFIEWEGKAAMFEHLGYTQELITKIGVLEIVLAVLFLIPQTAFVAAILLTGYLGGATATHVRVGDPFFIPIVMGVVLWIGLGLRRPQVFALAFGTGGGASAEVAQRAS